MKLNDLAFFGVKEFSIFRYLANSVKKYNPAEIKEAVKHICQSCEAINKPKNE